jgi:plasmid replication initiation protein
MTLPITMTEFQIPSLTAPLFDKRTTNYQSNLFTESRQEFTELEKKIVVLVVNQLGNMVLKGELKLNANIIFHIPFASLTKDNHKKIADAAASLQSKRLIYRDDAKGKFDYLTPFPHVRSEQVDGKKVIEITMFSAIVPHFAELGQRYTKYDIDIMLSLSSVYAQRMFEITSMYVNRGQYQFSYAVDRLMNMLNCPERYTFSDFKKYALEIARNELQNKANIILDWAPSKKEGKRITELLFTVKTNRQLAAEGIEYDRQHISQLPLHEAIQQAFSLMAGYKLAVWQKDLITSDHEMLNNFFRIHTEISNGLRPNVKNPTAYLAKSLGIDQAKKKSTTKTQSKVEVSSIQMRSSEVKSLGSIFSSMQSDDKWK